MIWIWECRGLGSRSRSSGNQRFSSDRLSLDISLLVFPVDYLPSACLCVFMKAKGEKIQDWVWTVHKCKRLLDMPSSTLCSLFLPLPTGDLPFLAILSLYHFPEHAFTPPLVCCDKYLSLCLGRLLPTLLTSCSTPWPVPGDLSLDYMIYFNLFFRFTGPCSGSFYLVTPDWLGISSSTAPLVPLSGH